MTSQPSPALEVALAYYDAWTGKDLDRAMTYIAQEIVCERPPDGGFEKCFCRER